MTDDADRARRLLESCQMPGYDPEGAETYPAVEDGGVNSIGNALAAAQVLATLAVAAELRRSNEDRSLFYREVLDVLTQAKGPAETARCTAMRGKNSHDRCTHPAGHTEFVRTLLHVDEAGIAFSDPVGYLDEGSPVGSGQPAAAREAQDPAEPRVWRHHGTHYDPDPGEMVRVRDCHGDVWSPRGKDGGGRWWVTPETVPCRWDYMLKKWGPLTEVGPCPEDS